jgi:hypothetical protein
MANQVELAREARDLLRRNHPSETSVCIHLQHFNDDELSVAFRMNKHVNNIILVLCGLEDTTNWDSMRRVLSMRETLKRFALLEAPGEVMSHGFHACRTGCDRLDTRLQARLRSEG